MAQLLPPTRETASYQLIVDHYETAVSLQERIVTRSRKIGRSTKKDDEFLEDLTAALMRARQTLARAVERTR
jgi:hypothetical protein